MGPGRGNRECKGADVCALAMFGESPDILDGWGAWGRFGFLLVYLLLLFGMGRWLLGEEAEASS